MCKVMLFKNKISLREENSFFPSLFFPNVLSFGDFPLPPTGATKDEKLMESLLEMTFGEKIRKNDVYVVYASLSSSSVGRRIAWNFLRSRYGSFSLLSCFILALFLLESDY